MGKPEEVDRRLGLIDDCLAEIQGALRKYQARLKQPELIPGDPSKDVKAEALVHLREALVAKFEKVTGRKYVFEGAKDASAVKRLVFLNTTRDDVLARWEECLKAQFRGSQSISQFASRINEFGKGVASTSIKPVTSEDPYGR